MAATSNQGLPAAATPTFPSILFALALPTALLLSLPFYDCSRGIQTEFFKELSIWLHKSFWQVMEILKNFQNFHSKML